MIDLIARVFVHVMISVMPSNASLLRLGYAVSFAAIISAGKRHTGEDVTWWEGSLDFSGGIDIRSVLA